MRKIDVPVECEKWAKLFSETGKLVLLLLALYLLLHLSGCGFATWRDAQLAELEAGRWYADATRIPAGYSPLPMGFTIYSPSGRVIGRIR